MSYCTQTDIEREVLTPALLIQLTDDDADGQADAAVVEDAIRAASALVDSYCGGRYATPFVEPVPSIIRTTSAVLAGHTLLGRRGFDPDSDKAMVKRHEEAMQWLRDVGAGRAHVPVSGQVPEPAQQPVRLTSRQQQFDATTLERF